MTNGEYYIIRRDEQIRLAQECRKNNDMLGAEMHKNFADGLKIKLEKMTVEQCGQVRK